MSWFSEKIDQLIGRSSSIGKARTQFYTSYFPPGIPYIGVIEQQIEYTPGANFKAWIVE